MKQTLKKTFLIFSVLVLALAFTACQKQNKEEVKNSDQVEPTEQSQEQAQEKEASENEVTENETSSEEVTVGPISKIGLGSLTSTKFSKDASESEPAKAEALVTMAAVAFDEEGRIVDIKIDSAQTKANFSADNLQAQVDDSIDLRTKIEKGSDYNMKKASKVGKEFDEQIHALEEYLIGKTAEDFINMPVKTVNNVPQIADVPELESSTTIYIGSFQKVVKEAWDMAIDAKGTKKLGLGVFTDASGKDSKDGKPAMFQFNTYMAALGLDDDGKITANYIDVVQAKVELNNDGSIVEKFDDVLTKKDLKDDYNMRKASEIGREWFEQMEDFQAFTIGKTVEEVQNIPVKERDERHQNVPDLPELESTVTITVEGYQRVMGLAKDNADK